ncbi:MAG: hypothetical protein J2P28_04145 [Actinobacteria bacterium]|nr:hypothetical protein [Actinomycetota bacterium]
MTTSLLAKTLRLGLPLTAALAVAACGGTSSGGNSSGGQKHVPGTVIETRSGPVGTYLTDGSGRALYLWAKDPANSSVCSGACLGAWPALVVKGTLTTSGQAVSSDLGTITRKDGSKQVTYKGHALYYFAGDSAAGMLTGQDSPSFGAKWFLVSPTGTAITKAVPAGATASNSGGPGAWG